tara:strand:- start:5088 stop:5399 length:312 start_codon:yes stop_codon:yes gene_type:complete
MTNTRIYKKGESDFFKNIAAVAKRFKGKGGGPESESAVNAMKEDVKDGFVWFWSDNSDVSNLVARSAKYILEMTDYGETVSVKMDKKGFRSCCHAFKVSNEEE